MQHHPDFCHFLKIASGVTSFFLNCPLINRLYEFMKHSHVRGEN